MTVGLTKDHEELGSTVRKWVRRTVPEPVGDPGRRPAFWDSLAALGLTGLHLPEEYGGQGAGLLDLSVVLEEFGRGLVPGPFLPTVVAAAVIARSSNSGARADLLPGLADGSRVAAIALDGALDARVGADGSWMLDGTLGQVVSAAAADLVVVPFDGAGERGWAALETAALEVAPLPSLDLTRTVARVRAQAVPVPRGAVLTGLDARTVTDLAAVLIGAEAVGVAAWCLEQAAGYARDREQFGRPIGQFQGVKHQCARMATVVEQGRAAVWDAARALDEAAPTARFAVAVAAQLAPDAALDCARDCVQVHGGIGCTWEHHAHRYLRRASTLRVLAGPTTVWAQDTADLALAGGPRPVEVDLGTGSADRRAAIRSEAAALAAIKDETERFTAMGEGGWVAPHLDRPWGRGASPLEQVLIHQELRAAGVRGPELGIGAWVVPSLAGYGTPEQQERFLRPTLRGGIVWCQLFSEPGAGSDLASLSMRADRVEGGYRLTGQKTWTTLAHAAQWGICLARTGAAMGADKHDGITYFVVDMSAPGVEVRPLRELTGDTMFNEVFFDSVFVSDDCVVGEVGRGWQVARGTPANERVALSSGTAVSAGIPELLAFCARSPHRVADSWVRAEVGRLLARGQAVELLGLRIILKQLSGGDPAAESSVRKLLGVEFNQHVADFLWERQGPVAVREDADAADGALARSMLFGRSLTIYGGTTQVQLNIIGERLLGLPRDAGA